MFETNSLNKLVSHDEIFLVTFRVTPGRYLRSKNCKPIVLNAKEVGSRGSHETRRECEQMFMSLLAPLCIRKRYPASRRKCQATQH